MKSRIALTARAGAEMELFFCISDYSLLDSWFYEILRGTNIPHSESAQNAITDFKLESGFCLNQ